MGLYIIYILPTLSFCRFSLLGLLGIHTTASLTLARRVFPHVPAFSLLLTLHSTQSVRFHLLYYFFFYLLILLRKIALMFCISVDAHVSLWYRGSHRTVQTGFVSKHLRVPYSCQTWYDLTIINSVVAISTVACIILHYIHHIIYNYNTIYTYILVYIIVL